MVGISRQLVVLVCLLAVAYCFTAEEVEIFQLQKEIAKKYGDFYKFLKLPNGKSSTEKQINKNLRKLARKYHPDKNPKHKKLYARLNLATKILTNHSSRQTCDYYLKNGFPDYHFSKGGFFFQRAHPKTWFIIGFVLLVDTAFHYIILKLQYNSNRRRIARFIQSCKEQDTTDGLGEKSLFFKQHEDDPGKELVLRFGDVFVIEEDGSESLISEDTIEEPKLTDALLFKFLNAVKNRTVGKLFKSTTKKLHEETTEKIDVAEDNSNDDKKPKAEMKIKPGQKKMTLPNGKVIYSRKSD